ncbi:hypothetical protein BS17DRAFT_809898 [Gyrodon lividus]|nr:hypothetical protein BS17DRAFT_809898 [Gyrodon lividus]
MLASESSGPKNVSTPPLSPTLTGSTTSTVLTASTEPATLSAPGPLSTGHAMIVDTMTPDTGSPDGLTLHLQWFALLVLFGGSVTLVSSQCPLDMHAVGVGQRLGCAAFDALLWVVIPLNLGGSDWMQVVHLIWFLEQLIQLQALCTPHILNQEAQLVVPPPQAMNLKPPILKHTEGKWPYRPLTEELDDDDNDIISFV